MSEFLTGHPHAAAAAAFFVFYVLHSFHRTVLQTPACILLQSPLPESPQDSRAASPVAERIILLGPWNSTNQRHLNSHPSKPQTSLKAPPLLSPGPL